MTHHTPATPGSTRSILAPHMFVVGGKREMLQADCHMAWRRVVAGETHLSTTLEEMRELRGYRRAQWRSFARNDVNAVRSARRTHGECLARFYALTRGEV